VSRGIYVRRFARPRAKAKANPDRIGKRAAQWLAKNDGLGNLRYLDGAIQAYAFSRGSTTNGARTMHNCWTAENRDWRVTQVWFQGRAEGISPAKRVLILAMIKGDL
jgi:hypothetical protein